MMQPEITEIPAMLAETPIEIFLNNSALLIGVAVFALFMNFIEIMVAFIQAFIFTLLSSMYIGSSIEDNHEPDHGH